MNRRSSQLTGAAMNVGSAAPAVDGGPNASNLVVKEIVVDSGQTRSIKDGGARPRPIS